MTIALGVLLALACAIASNLAFFYKHRGARVAPPVCSRRPLHTARCLFGSRWFALGMLIAAGAWALHVAALSLAPLSLVQVVLAAGIVLVGVMAERIFGFDVSRRQWGALAITACGLILLALTLPIPHGSQSTYTAPVMAAFEGGLFGLAGLLLLAPTIGAPAEHHAATLGAAAGVLFGVSDVSIKALTGLVGAHSWSGFASPSLFVTLIASVVAFYASARALQLGRDPIAVIALTGTAANIAGIAGGIIVFGDPLPDDAVGAATEALALVMILIASALTNTAANPRLTRVGLNP